MFLNCSGKKKSQMSGNPDLLPFSEYKIRTYDEMETILLENGFK